MRLFHLSLKGQLAGVGRTPHRPNNGDLRAGRTRSISCGGAKISLKRCTSAQTWNNRGLTQALWIYP